jgi:exodeoxyribonuclease VII large subunit
MLEQKILKVSELNFLAKKKLEMSFSHIKVEGEISNFIIPKSGHSYFSLKDETAQVRAVMFYQNRTTLKFKPQNGDYVIVAAQVSLYEVRGDYQLIVDNMELAGAGALHAKFLQLKNSLLNEGLFDAKYKKILPRLPKCIGIITSPTGAVIRDILYVLQHRSSISDIIIYPVKVQGKEAAQQITNILTIANKRQECEVLILARGGGSLEDLWPFNEEVVARAIFSSHIPIVSAVGHETDFTIADFAADLRAPTPASAAELVTLNLAEWLDDLMSFKQRLINGFIRKLHYYGLLLTNLVSKLRDPRSYLMEQMQRLDDIEVRLQMVMRHRLIYIKEYLIKIGVSLNVASPMATLMRGYAILSKENEIVYTISDVATGDRIKAKLSDGKLECLVQEIINTQEY